MLKPEGVRHGVRHGVRCRKLGRCQASEGCRRVKLFVEDRGLIHSWPDRSSITADGAACAGFRITNPNAKQTCGCGKSFRPEARCLSMRSAAFRKGHSGTHGTILVPMLEREARMAAIVAIGWWWRGWKDALSSYAERRIAECVLLAAFRHGFGNGVLPELSLVYLQDKGRWRPAIWNTMGFKFVLFFINGVGALVFMNSMPTRPFGLGKARRGRSCCPKLSSTNSAIRFSGPPHSRR